MKTLLGLVFGALLLVGGARAAHAGSGYGYICNAHDMPSASWGYGNFGGEYVNVYSGPSCTGTFVGGGIFCTTGAVDSSCSTAGYFRDEAQQMSFSEKIESAENAGQHIYLYSDGSNLPFNILFYAQGW